MPVVEELLDELSCAVWFTKLDLRAGYHQIRLHEADEYKTAFKTHVTMNFRLFGLTNAPPTLQSSMNTILAELTRVCVLVFVDDILIYSKSLQDHVTHLQQVFDLLKQNQLYVKLNKCSFAQPQIEYMGHVISGQGVATD